MNENKFTERLVNELRHLELTDNFRTLHDTVQRGKMIISDGHEMINLSSNDYLGLATDKKMQTDFFINNGGSSKPLTASSSRLMTGNFPEFAALECLLAQLYEREDALVFNCGYHANTGILPAIADSKTLILADKLVHASIIDGLQLCKAKSIRFRHNDYEQLENLLERYSTKCDTVIVVVESIYSMDGDCADLRHLVNLKKRFPMMMLYVDEAHAFGVRGANGLGLAEELDCVKDIDFLVGTFGKAIASVGAFVVCDTLIKQYLVNKMRPFIFTTALPPLNVAWTTHIVQNLSKMKSQRQHLVEIGTMLHEEIKAKTGVCLSSSQIVPFVVGTNKEALSVADKLQQHGFYCMAIRTPTVAQGTARIRFSLTCAITSEEVESLCKAIRQI